jgi:O-6-methylguanine DNA methyltransferase
MQLYVLGFRLELPGPMCELSRRFPDVDWSVRPLGNHWLAEPPADAGSGPGATVMVSRSTRERALLREIEAWDATVLPPLSWRAGVVTARLLSRVATPPAEWRRRYPGMTLVAKRAIAPERLALETGSIPRWELGLTDRQREVLDHAVRDGYYEVPRRTTVLELARSLSLGRSTVEEHLRAAESIVVRAVAPLAVGTDPTVAGSPEGESLLRTFARFSSDLDLYVWMTLNGDRIVRVAMRPDVPTDSAGERHPYLDRILDHVASGRDDLRDLPVELGVSEFERGVLEELRRIPPGATASYQEVAARVGRPQAARAVGNAVARNPVPIVVPCHRVIPRAGGVGNYSGGRGPPTKRVLLDHEGVRFGRAKASGRPGPSDAATSRRRRTAG